MTISRKIGVFALIAALVMNNMVITGGGTASGRSQSRRSPAAAPADRDLNANQHPGGDTNKGAERTNGRRGVTPAHSHLAHLRAGRGWLQDRHHPWVRALPGRRWGMAAH
jgi:hypothetical protein